MKKRLLSLALALMLLTGCAGGSVVKKTAPLMPPEEYENSLEESYPGEENPHEEESSEESASEDDKLKKEQEKLEEQKRLEEEQQKLEEQKRLEEEQKKLEEQKRLEEEQKKLEEQKRLEEEQKKSEEQKRLEEEQKKLEDQKRLEEEQKKLEEEKRLEEEQKKLEEKQQNEIKETSSGTAISGEMKAVWVSYLEFLTLAQGQTEAGFAHNMEYIMATCADFGLNTIFVQVRPFGDALYESEYFPYSYCLTGTEGVNPGYDPLDIIIKEAKKYGLSVHAWINPYRVRVPGSNKEICSHNIVNNYIKSGSDAVIRYNGGTYYNPASQNARDLIVAGVLEIIENYDVDGIHMDDYFYPTTDAAFDSKYYNAYVSNGGKLSHDAWRRKNVDTLLQQLYYSIKQTDSSIIFGVSPQARMDINYNAQYADVAKWLANDGYLDYVCPQIYFGFNHPTVPYEATLKMWNDMAKKGGKKLYVGLAAYKCGIADSTNEWVNNADILSRQVLSAREYSQYGGFAIYRFDSIFRPEASVKNYIANERKALKAIM